MPPWASAKPVYTAALLLGERGREQVSAPGLQFLLKLLKLQSSSSIPPSILMSPPLPCSHASSNFCLLPTLPQAASEPGMLCFSLLAPPFHSRLRSGKHAHTLPFLHTFMCLIRWSPPDPETSQEQKPMSSIWVTRDSRFSVYPSK